MMIPVKDDKDLLRHEKTKSLVINNDKALTEYETKRLAILTEKQRIATLEQKVSNIESLLIKILEKVS